MEPTSTHRLLFEGPGHGLFCTTGGVEVSSCEAVSMSPKLTLSYADVTAGHTNAIEMELKHILDNTELPNV